MNKKDIFFNIFIAILSQLISLILSFLIAFILPKILDIEAYSYWQLFIFYISYVGFFHFGINDGVYLKYGNLNLDKMNKEYVAGQFHILLLIQLLLIIILSIFIFNTQMGIDRHIVCIYTILYMLIFNLSNYLAYILQAANLTRLYSYSVLIDKLFFIIALLLLICLNINSLNIYIIFYIIGKALCFLYCIIKCRHLIFIYIKSYKDAWRELADSMNVGIKLTLSAIASMLILGIGRFAIDTEWGIVIFGQISFAISLSYFMLTFIQQISMVFFPILKRVNYDKQNTIYNYMYMFCFFILPLIYLLIIPLKTIIEFWLPQYSQSLYFLGMILPLCIFDAKMNLIYNTFFKVLRKEKILMKLNIRSMIISGTLTLISVFIFHSYYAVILSMIVAITYRCIHADYIISKQMKFNSSKFIITEAVLAITYIVISITYNDLTLLTILLIIYALIYTTFYQYFKQFIQTTKNYIIS